MGIVWRYSIFVFLTPWILGCVADFAYDGVLQGPGSWDGRDRAFLAVITTLSFGLTFWYYNGRQEAG